METNTELLNRIEAHIKGRLAVAESRAASSELYEGKKIAYTSILGFVNSLRAELAATTAENTEDERIRMRLLDFIKSNSATPFSLYEEFTPQQYILYLEKQKEQKPAGWSEEDEKMLDLIVENLTELKDRFGKGYGRVGDCIDWLKSIRPQPKRKPMDFEHRILGRVDISSCCD